jgi:L-asparagine transporter-like permease
MGKRLLTQWAATTCIAALFFTLVPLAFAQPQARPPIAVGILFPAIIFGFVFLLRFARGKN